MKLYAILSFVIALISLCFIDNNIQPIIAKGGRIVLAVSTVVFVITETIYLITGQLTVAPVSRTTRPHFSYSARM